MTETSHTVDCNLRCPNCIQYEEYINELEKQLEQQKLTNENLKVEIILLKQNVSRTQEHFVDNVERGDKVLVLKRLLLRVLTLSIEILVERYIYKI